MRARYGIADDACVFLLVGSAYARKGVARALEALAPCRRPRTCWSSAATAIPRATLALARRLGVAHRVTFAGAQQDPKPFYGAADAFVLPTLYDALSNAVLEALACGLPVVTSDRCGAGELVARAWRGHRVRRARHRAPSPRACTRCSRRTRARAASAGALAAMRPLTPDAMAARLVALYESSCRRALAPPPDGVAGRPRVAALYSAPLCGRLAVRASLPDAAPPAAPPIPMTGANLYSRLLRYVRPYRWAFGLAVLGMMIVAAGDLMLAWLVIPIVRNFESPDPLGTRWLPLTIVGVFLLRGIGAYISEFGMGWTGYRVVFDLRRDLIDKLLALPTPYYDTHAAGVIQSKISFDAHQLASAASGAITNAIRSTLTIVVSFGYLMWLNWRLTLLTFIVVPIVGVVIRYFSRRLRRIARDIQDRSGSMTQVLEEMIGGHRVVRVFGGEDVRAQSRGRRGQPAAQRDDEGVVGHRGELAAHRVLRRVRGRLHRLDRAAAERRPAASTSRSSCRTSSRC